MKSGDVTSLRRLFAEIPVSECNGDFATLGYQFSSAVYKFEHQKLNKMPVGDQLARD
jgi:hypothetical protein